MSFDLEGIDTVNKALILTVLLALVLQLAYLAFPAGLKKILDNLDYRKGVHTLSYTGCTSMFFGFAAMLTKGNQVSQELSSDEKATLSVQEKSFRNRQKFQTEISLFALIVLASIFTSLHILMNINRKRRYYKEIVKADAAAKK